MIYRFNIPIPDFPHIKYEDVSVMLVISKICFINVGYKGVCITLGWQHDGSVY